MAKYRISKSEVDAYVSRLIAKGQSKVFDKKIGTSRIIETNKVRIIAKSNGWVEILPI